MDRLRPLYTPSAFCLRDPLKLALAAQVGFKFCEDTGP